MFRKSIIALAAAATLAVAALTAGPAEARWGGGGHMGGHMHMGGMHMGGFHHFGGFHVHAYPRFAFRHRFFVRRYAVAPIFIDNGCWRWVHFYHHWRRHRIWVCG